MGVPDLPGVEVVASREPLEWWTPLLMSRSGRFHRVGEFMPSGFERYARLLHPPPDNRDGGGFARWEEVAEWSGATLTPTSYFRDIATREDGTRWTEVGDEPWEGELPDNMYPWLARILRRFTTTPEKAYFCIWAGRGELELESDDPALLHVNAEQTRSGRFFAMYRGDVIDVDRLVVPDTIGWPLGFMAPSYWWPEDRAWFVFTEIDAQSTYIGGPSDLIEPLCGMDEWFEAVPASLDDPFDGTHPGQIDW